VKNNIILKRLLSLIMAGVTTVTVSTGCNQKQNSGSGHDIILDDTLISNSESVENTNEMLIEGSAEVVQIPNIQSEKEAIYRSDQLRVVEVYDPINKFYKHWIVYEAPISLLIDYSDCEREDFGFYDGFIENFDGVKNFSYYISIQNPDDHFYSSNKYFTGLVDSMQVVGSHVIEVFTETNGVNKNYYYNHSKDVTSTDSILYYDYSEEFIVDGEHYKSVMPTNEIRLYPFASLFDKDIYIQHELEEILASFDGEKSLDALNKMDQMVK